MKTLTLVLLLLSPLSALAADKAPEATKPTMVEVATCNDGKVYSHVTGERRGACSGHGGVASWADGSPVKAKGGSRTSYK